MRHFSLLIKPSGSDCNMECNYCFYKNRAPAVGSGYQRMTTKVLEKMTRDYLSLGFPTASFSWQGGEPTLMGLDFYKQAVEFQSKYAVSNQQVTNALQTNGLLLIDQNWCKFLHETDFLVGISVDGPKELHDYYRHDLAGHGTFGRIMRAIENCKEHEVKFNTLTLLNSKNVQYPDILFDFFVDNGISYLQFIPCIETNPSTGQIADFSITPEQYGHFLCRLFDRWYDYGPEKISIRDFDSILSYLISGTHTICTFNKQCSDYIVIEHTGDSFVCDFFVRPEWNLGNIFDIPIQDLAASERKRSFARAKQDLPNKCLICRYLNICRGGCLKDRVGFPSGSFQNESYFCPSYKKFFDYAMPRFNQLAAKFSSGQLQRTELLSK